MIRSGNASLRWCPRPKPDGRPATVPRGEIVNALLYIAKNGCAWRSLPHDLPPYRMVFRYFRVWQQDGTLTKIHDTLRTDVRQKVGHKPKPTVAILDSQTDKTTQQIYQNLRVKNSAALRA